MASSCDSQYDVIQQLRFPMIVLVTFAHSYGRVEEGYSLLTSDWNTYEFLKLLVSQTLVKVAMPVFFIMSGYLFFANVDKWDYATYKRKMLRRVKTLLIPYLVWNLLMAVKLKAFSWSMFWSYWMPAGRQVDWFGQEQLMTAPANMPLWFLRDLMVVSLLTPVIYVLIRKLGYWLLAVLTIYYLSGVCAFVPGLSAYAIYFFSFGAFFSIRGMNHSYDPAAELTVSRRTVPMVLEISVYVLSVLLAVAMLLSYGTPVFSSFMLPFRLTGAIAVFCLASRILSATSMRIPTVVCDSAYFIFLAHFVFFSLSLMLLSFPSLAFLYLPCLCITS